MSPGGDAYALSVDRSDGLSPVKPLKPWSRGSNWVSPTECEFYLHNVENPEKSKRQQMQLREPPALLQRHMGAGDPPG